jgi:lipoyl(octanoyl) transferase
VDPDLTAYATIIPCGLVGVGVTSMAAELGRPVGVAEVATALLPHLHDLLAFTPYAQSPDLGLRPELSPAG